MIELGQTQYRTLEDNLYVDGRKVYEVFVNGEKVYPDRETKYKYWVTGHTKIDILRMRKRQTWYESSNHNAETHIDFTYQIESEFPIYHKTEGIYDTVLICPSYAALTYPDFFRMRVRVTGRRDLASFGTYISEHWGATPSSTWIKDSSDMEDWWEILGTGLHFGSPDTLMEVFPDYQNVITINGKQLLPDGLRPYTPPSGAIYGTYASFWPDDNDGYESIPSRIGMNCPWTISSSDDIATMRSGESSVDCSDNHWGSAQEWAKQWLDEYRLVYG